MGELEAEVTQERYSVGLGGGVAWMPSKTFQVDAFVDVFPYSEATSLGSAIPRGITGIFNDPVRMRVGAGASILF